MHVDERERLCRRVCPPFPASHADPQKDTCEGTERNHVGSWKNGVQSGKGVLTCKDGRKYDGDWKDGKQNGVGTFSKDGDIYGGPSIALGPCWLLCGIKQRLRRCWHGASVSVSGCGCLCRGLVFDWHDLRHGAGRGSVEGRGEAWERKDTLQGRQCLRGRVGQQQKAGQGILLYLPTRVLDHSRYWHSIWCNARPRTCPVLAERMVLSARADDVGRQRNLTARVRALGETHAAG